MSKKMTKRQRIDASREARLWITSVLVPIGTILAVRPDLAEKAKNKLISAKDWAKNKYEDLKDKVGK